MSRDPYSERVRALFASPLHAGSMSTPYRVLVDDQGIRIELSATLDGDVIQRLRFRAWGCPHVVAAAEWICTQLEGESAARLQDFAITELMQSLAVPVEKSGRILVVEDAVRALGAAIKESSTIAGQAEQD